MPDFVWHPEEEKKKRYQELYDRAKFGPLPRGEPVELVPAGKQKQFRDLRTPQPLDPKPNTKFGPAPVVPAMAPVASADGWQDVPDHSHDHGDWQDVPIKSSAETGSDESPLETGLKHAASSASLFGMPVVAGMADALTGQQTETDRTKRDIDFDKKGLLDRYYANKAVYSREMKAGEKANPISATVGEVLPALIPGGGKASIGKLALRGLGSGAIRGALGGDAETLRGDWKGTLEDTATSGAIGGSAGFLGGLGGKAIEKVGEKASSAFTGQRLEQAKSIIGKFRKMKQEASSATKAAGLHEGLAKLEGMMGQQQAAQAPTLRLVAGGGSPTVAGRAVKASAVPMTPAGKVLDRAPQVAADLEEGSAGNLERVQKVFQENQAKFGRRGVPSMGQAKGLAEKELIGGSPGVLKSIAKGAAQLAGRAGGGGLTGAGLGYAFDVDPMVTGKIGAAGAAMGTLARNPKILRAIAKSFPSIGQKLAKAGSSIAAQEAVLSELPEDVQAKIRGWAGSGDDQNR